MKIVLDAAALERLFAIWNVPIPRSDLVLFALRGSLPKAPVKGWVKTVALETVTPDHEHMRCTIGIWDRKNGRLFAAPGSTVPHRDNVLKAAARKGVMKGRGTNQLEPGYYTDLTKGEHLQGKPTGHAALRQTGYRFYRRAHLKKKGTELYTNRDPLYFGNPYDNLHCAWNADSGAAGFRSAGCLGIAGWLHSPRLPDARPNSGAWKIFHDLLYAAPQKTFPLLLLPANEAGAALAKKNPSPQLVYGSEGDAVEALQKKLTAKGAFQGAINGKLGVGTYRAWMKTKK